MVQIVNDQLGIQPNDMFSGVRCILSLRSELVDRKKGVVT